MAINLKKLQATARRRLELRGSVEWRAVQKSLGTEYLSTWSNGPAHVVSYSNIASLTPADVFHEMCKAKLNELGFTTIETAALDAMRECCKDDPKCIRDANSVVTIVSEMYVNSILFSLFPEESKTRRERMILRFESSDALTTLHTQLGFWGTAGVCYYRVASSNSRMPFPEDQVAKAIARASDGIEIRKEYDATNSLLEELPKMDVQIERLAPEDSIRIVDIILRLFSAKTGLKCE